MGGYFADVIVHLHNFFYPGLEKFEIKELILKNLSLRFRLKNYRWKSGDETFFIRHFCLAIVFDVCISKRKSFKDLFIRTFLNRLLDFHPTNDTRISWLFCSICWIQKSWMIKISKKMKFVLIFLCLQTKYIQRILFKVGWIFFFVDLNKR